MFLNQLSFKHKRLIKGLMIAILLSAAISQFAQLNWAAVSLSNHWSAPVELLIFGLLAHAIQASMTVYLVSLCSRVIKFKEALCLNIIGGLYGLLFPMGSVGFKAMSLKKNFKVSISQYSSYYGLTFFCQLWSSLVIGCFLTFGSLSELAHLALMCSVFISPWLLYESLKSLHRFEKRFPASWQGILKKVIQEDINGRRFFQQFLTISIIQSLGITAYVGIYHAALSWLGVDAPLVSILVFVLIQSLLFLAPIIPGNLAILEGAGAWWFHSDSIEMSVAISAIVLMRASTLGSLLILSPWAFYVKHQSIDLKRR